MKTTNLNLILIVCVIGLITVSAAWAMGTRPSPRYDIGLGNRSIKEIRYSKMIVNDEILSVGIVPYSEKGYAGHGGILHPIPDIIKVRWSYEYIYDEDQPTAHIYECSVPVREELRKNKIENIKLEILGDYQVRVSFWKGRLEKKKKLGEYVVDCGK